MKMIRAKTESRNEATNMMKGMGDLVEKIRRICSIDELISDKIEELLFSQKCAALTTKGTVCSAAAKERGFCGRHAAKESRACRYRRKDGSTCSLNSLEGRDVCWVHREKQLNVEETKEATVVQEQRGLRRSLEKDDDDDDDDDDEPVIKRRIVRTAGRYPRAIEQKSQIAKESCAEKESQIAKESQQKSQIAKESCAEKESQIAKESCAEQKSQIAKELRVEQKSQTVEKKQDFSITMRMLEPFDYRDSREEAKCPIICDSGKRKGTVCGAELKEGKLVCSTHRTRSLKRNFDDLKVEYKCAAMDILCDEKDLMRPKKDSLTRGFREQDIEGDDDCLIDEHNALPKFKPKRCVFLNENGQLCCEPVCFLKASDSKLCHMCKDHKKFARQYEHNSGTNRYFDAFWSPKRVLLEPAFSIAPNFRWFPNLNLYAHMTRKGPIVVGKTLSMLFPESLEGFPVSRDLLYNEDGRGVSMEEEKLDIWLKKYPCDNDPVAEETPDEVIRRCHNNGLLYKVLPQEVLHKQYNLPSDLDTIRGHGFTSFEQMIQERPTLYIKYWNAWLGHIRRAKDFTKFMGCNPNTVKRLLNADEDIDWNVYFKRVGPKIGLYHVEVPAPTIEEVVAPGFNPFRYCRKWVTENLPEKINEPWFPPMYILYPFPLEYYEEVYFHQNRLMIEFISNKEQYAHYNMRGTIRNSLQSWMQWLKFGSHEGQFSKLYAFKIIEDSYPDDLKAAVAKACAEKEEFRQKYPEKYASIYSNYS